MGEGWLRCARFRSFLGWRVSPKKSLHVGQILLLFSSSYECLSSPAYCLEKTFFDLNLTLLRGGVSTGTLRTPSLDRAAPSAPCLSASAGGAVPLTGSVTPAAPCAGLQEVEVGLWQQGRTLRLRGGGWRASPGTGQSVSYAEGASLGARTSHELPARLQGCGPMKVTDKSLC